ncbi:hypothetical protein [Maridesulfovibrio sp.]|uniref:hypothetical protein n=1 Tax=Maridesulfovibrio sp. TaxID=2795000 RepID=UPI002A18B04D|nr:hypothetical protein [Maridesulfovibrio sp.]
MTNIHFIEFPDTTFPVVAERNGKNVGRTTQMVRINEIANKLHISPNTLTAELAQADCPLYSYEEDIFATCEDVNSTLKNKSIPLCNLGQSNVTCELIPYIDKSISEGTDMLEATYRILDLHDIAIRSEKFTLAQTSALLNVDYYAELVGVDSKSVVGSTLEQGYPVFSTGNDVFVAAKDLAACLEY